MKYKMYSFIYYGQHMYCKITLVDDSVFWNACL
jgi:hypothetical protein